MTPRIRTLMAICLTNWFNQRFFFYQAPAPQFLPGERRKSVHNLTGVKNMDINPTQVVLKVAAEVTL